VPGDVFSGRDNAFERPGDLVGRPLPGHPGSDTVPRIGKAHVRTPATPAPRPQSAPRRELVS
jgi:hypothetical protein